ncbi:thymidylate synthase [Candidatus Microgenomates bacterium]|nr:thymidylate synthase [Candidatus Microgenomates bacterium]
MEHVSPVEYRQDREPNTAYRDLMQAIKTHGRRGETQMAEDAYRIKGYEMRFRFAEDGFPVITERNLNQAATEHNISNHQVDLGVQPIKGPLRQGLAEIIGFMNGARTVAELETFGCKWWASWASPEKCQKRGLEPGDLGPGSYGAAFHDFPTSEGQPFNQIQHLVEQIRSMPHLRTHVLTPFIPQYLGRGQDQYGNAKQQQVVVVPCHGLVHFIIEDGDLTLVHIQRSADVPTGFPYNLVNYGAMAMMMAQVTNTTPVEVVHFISDAHIYVRQMDDVEEMLSRTPRPLPILKIDPSVSDIFAFRPEHFSIAEYNPHPPMKIDTPI